MLSLAEHHGRHHCAQLLRSGRRELIGTRPVAAFALVPSFAPPPTAPPVVRTCVVKKHGTFCGEQVSS